MTKDNQFVRTGVSGTKVDVIMNIELFGLYLLQIIAISCNSNKYIRGRVLSFIKQVL